MAWCETHCFANIGFDTSHQLALLRRSFKQGYRTVRIVLVYCPNDVCDLIPEWHEAGKRIYDRAAQLGPLRASYALDMLWCRWIAATDPDARDYHEIVLTGYSGAIWHQQTERLRELRELCRVYDADFAIVLFPFLHDLEDKRFHQAYAQLERFCEQEDIPFLSLLPTLQNNAQEELVVNRYDPHPNERAHALAAEAVEQFLDDLDAR